MVHLSAVHVHVLAHTTTTTINIPVSAGVAKVLSDKLAQTHSIMRIRTNEIYRCMHACMLIMCATVLLMLTSGVKSMHANYNWAS